MGYKATIEKLRIKKRAAKGSRQKFERAMRKVAKVKPMKGDEL